MGPEKKMGVRAAALAAAMPAAALALPAAPGPKPVLDGFDMVSYFSLPTAADGVQGSAEHSFTMESFDFTTTPPTSVGNYTFWFESEKNRAAFAKDPWLYAPRWGGF